MLDRGNGKCVPSSIVRRGPSDLANRSGDLVKRDDPGQPRAELISLRTTPPHPPPQALLLQDVSLFVMVQRQVVS